MAIINTILSIAIVALLYLIFQRLGEIKSAIRRGLGEEDKRGLAPRVETVE